MLITYNLRITRLDDKNLVLEHYAKVLNPKTKTVSYKWQRLGYFGGVHNVLNHILANDRLVDINTLATLEEYVETLRNVSNEVIKRCVTAIEIEVEKEYAKGQEKKLKEKYNTEKLEED